MAHQARKRFGQHFLVDDGVIQGIVGIISPRPLDGVIEIGPGLGAMTLPLLGHLNQMSIVEIDRDLVSHWAKQGLTKLNIIQADALQYDFLEWAKRTHSESQSKGSRVLIVGNLPYNISSPLLFHLMGAADYVDEQVFMLQAEVIDRMVAHAGDSEYGRLSVMLQSRYDMESVMDVPPEAFNPPPKVNSAIVRMIPKKNHVLNSKQYEALEALVSAAFAQRRKVLRNNLQHFKDRLQLNDEVLALRAQDISVEQYVSWACTLANQ